MPTLRRTSITAEDMHLRTAILEQDAGDVNDEFLKYLYAMALRHIEEETTVPRLPKDSANAICPRSGIDYRSG